MKINHDHRYQAEVVQTQVIDPGLCALIQLYASELNFHELFKGLKMDTINWEYFELFLMQQIEEHSDSAAHEANYAYFEVLKQAVETIQKSINDVSSGEVDEQNR